MKDLIAKLRKAIKAGYKHILLAILAALIFFVLLFPYNDLAGLITSRVSAQTQNQVYLQFDSLSPVFQPQPGIRLGDVFFASSFAPSLSIDELSISPALSALTAQKPRGVVTARGILGGDLKVNSSSGEATAEGVERERIVLKLDQLNLNEIVDLVKAPISLQGQLSGETTALANLGLQVQPEADIEIQIANFILPATEVEIVVLPELRLNQVRLKGRLSNGQLIIEEGRVGGDGDELQGSIQGNIALRLSPGGAGVVPLFGAYSLDVDLTAQKSLQTRAPDVFAMLNTLVGSNMRSETQNGTRYALKLTGAGMGIPNLRPLK